MISGWDTLITSRSLRSLTGARLSCSCIRQHRCVVEHCCRMSRPYSLKFHKILPGQSRICFLPVRLRDSRTFVSSSATRAETCRCCLAVCTNTVQQTLPRRHPTESNTNSNAYITILPVRLIDRRSQRSQLSSPPHKFSSAATILSYPLPTPRKV